MGKSCNHEQNINKIHNEQQYYSCFQQLRTLRLKAEDLGKLGYLDEKIVKYSNYGLVSSPLAKNSIL